MGNANLVITDANYQFIKMVLLIGVAFLWFVSVNIVLVNVEDTSPIKLWVKRLIGIAAVTVLFGGLGYMVNTYIYSVPILNTAFRSIDRILTLTMSFIPWPQFRVYYVYTLLLTWIIYLGVASYRYAQFSRQQRQLKQADKKAREEAERKEMESAPVEAQTPDEAQAAVDTTESLQEQDAKPEVPVHFLTSDDLASFKRPKLAFFGTKNTLALRSVNRKAKKLDGMMIKEAPTGYTLVYSTANGYNEARQFFSSQGIDIADLPASESIVEFNSEGIIRALPLIKEIERMETKEKEAAV